MTRVADTLLVPVLGLLAVGCQPVDALAPDGGGPRDAIADARRGDGPQPPDATGDVGMPADAASADDAAAVDAARVDAAAADAARIDAEPRHDGSPLDAGRRDAQAPADARPAVDGGAADAAPRRDAGAVCQPAEIETRRCGLNGRGEQARVCTGDGFSPWGQCIDPDACVDDDLDVDTCDEGVRQRRCRGGQWGQWRCETDRCLPWQFTDIDVEGHVWLGDSSVGAFGQHRGSCGGEGVELTYQLALAARTALCLRAVGHGIDPILYVRRACRDPGSEVACDDDGGGLTTAQLRLTLDAGSYIVFADSAELDRGGQFSLYVLQQTPDGDCPDPE